MKYLITVGAVLATLCSTHIAFSQASPSAASSPATAAAPAKRTEVYSVTFIHAAAGKTAALEDWAKKSGASGSNGGHGLVLRHEAGSPWDFVAIGHEGAKATVDPAGNPAGPAMRPLMDWHDDTFVNGPSWSEFAKQMDLDPSSGKPKSPQSVYVVSVYRPVVGQDDALEKFLSEPPPAGDLTAGVVLLQHLEGGAWRFCTLTRYKNYQDYGTSEATAVDQTAKGGGGWFKLRELCSFHNDTVAVHLVR
jgi:hypothetical protein